VSEAMRAKFSWNREEFGQKSLAVSKSLQYSKLRYFGSCASRVGFGVEKWDRRLATRRGSSCAWFAGWAEVCDEAVGSPGRLDVLCSSFYDERKNPVS